MEINLEANIIKKGEIVTVSRGEYSDYCVNGLFKALVEFNYMIQLVRWANATGRKVEDGRVDGDYENNSIDFIPWLIINEFIDEIDYRELHTGSYGMISLSIS